MKPYSKLGQNRFDVFAVQTKPNDAKLTLHVLHNFVASLFINKQHRIRFFTWLKLRTTVTARKPSGTAAASWLRGHRFELYYCTQCTAIVKYDHEQANHARLLYHKQTSHEAIQFGASERR